MGWGLRGGGSRNFGFLDFRVRWSGRSMGAQGIMGEQTAPAEAAVSASSGRFQVLRGHPVACSREAVGGSEGEGSISVWEPVCGCRAAAHARGKALEQTEGGCKTSVVGTVVCGRRSGALWLTEAARAYPRCEAISAARSLLARCRRVIPARTRRKASSAEHEASARASARLEMRVAAVAPKQHARAVRGTLVCVSFG